MEIDKIECEYNLVLEDYLVVEEYSYMNNLNPGYNKLKNNNDIWVYLLGILGFVFFSYFSSASLFFILPIWLVFIIVIYKKGSARLGWRWIKARIAKAIADYQFAGDCEGMNSCRMQADFDSLCVWSNGESTVFDKDHIIDAYIDQEYFLLYNDQNRGISIPVKRLDEVSRTFLEEIAKKWKKSTEEKGNEC